MLTNRSIGSKTYDDLMESLKKQNREYQEFYNSKECRIGRHFCRFLDNLKNPKILFKKIKMTFSSAKNDKQFPYIENKTPNYNKPNYFSDSRIAIYTCIFGDCDIITEPLFVPDNCDFYIITDNEIKNDSKWKKIDLNTLNCIKERINSFSNSKKNRYIKMHPHEIFTDYKYSIYIDGNIKVVTDLTEYVNRLNENGIALHKHSRRDCIYDEAEACLICNKDTEENINKQIEYLKNKKFPKHYGLLECNVIVREHNNPICIRIMDDWWNEYLTHSKRDQLSLSYVLYKNNIKVEDVALLGDNIFKNYSFRIINHN